MAKTLASLRARRGLVLLALVLVSLVAGRCGHPSFGMWDGPL